jgi:hypothetical protein
MSLLPPRFLLPVGVFRSIAGAHARAFPLSRRLQSTHASPKRPTDPNYIYSTDGLLSDLSMRKHPRQTTPRKFDADGNELDPYAGGPSAISKAVHLFFFTEIIRGAHPVSPWLFQCLTVIQECGSCSSSSSGHRTQLCILSRKVLCHLAFAENTPSADTPAERRDVSVSFRIEK